MTSAQICYLARVMAKRFTKKKKLDTSNLDPAALAKLKKDQRASHLIKRTLLRRRRAKSNQ